MQNALEGRSTSAEATGCALNQESASATRGGQDQTAPESAPGRSASPAFFCFYRLPYRANLHVVSIEASLGTPKMS